MRFRARNAFAQAVPMTREGHRSWGKRRVDRVRVEGARCRWLFLNFKVRQPLHLRLDKQDRDRRQKWHWRRLTKAPTSFLVETPLSDPRKGSGADLGAHSQWQSSNPLTPFQWMGPSMAFTEHQEGEGNTASQQCARCRRNGTMSYVTHRLHCQWSSRIVFFKTRITGGPSRGWVGGSWGWAEEQRPSPAVVSPLQAARSPRLPAVTLRQT